MRLCAVPQGAKGVIRGHFPHPFVSSVSRHGHYRALAYAGDVLIVPLRKQGVSSWCPCESRGLGQNILFWRARLLLSQEHR